MNDYKKKKKVLRWNAMDNPVRCIREVAIKALSRGRDFRRESIETHFERV